MVGDSWKTGHWGDQISGRNEHAVGRHDRQGQDIAGYTPLFEKAYPGEGISESTVAKAIASYERTIISGIAPFDEWVKGKGRCDLAFGQTRV